MDRREALDTFGLATAMGDVADDVVIACERAPLGLTATDLEALDRALVFVEGLAAERRAMSVTSRSLQCMAPLALQSTVVASSTKRSDVDDEEFSMFMREIHHDLEQLRSATPESTNDAASDRLKIFFGCLAEQTLRSSRRILETYSRGSQWTFAAPAF